MERIFSNAQKRHLYLSAEGRCERCGSALGQDWEAHHKIRYADGGVTELTNGIALCQRCHILTHRRIGMVTPRGWQEIALEKFIESRTLSFLLEACPGAGKTIFSGLAAAQLFEQDSIDFCVCVVPTTVLKGDDVAGFMGDWHKVGIELTTVLKDGKDAPSEFKGGVICYQQLPTLISTIETWKKNRLRLLFVFDEIHHASEDNQWGNACERAARCSVKILAMTGTPFRGDGRRISFVNYDGRGIAIADHRYEYREAVRDRVCRPVEFMTDDGMAEFIRNNEEFNVRLSDAKTDEELSGATGTIFRADSKWLEAVVSKADDALSEYRTWDADAGGLVICRPGTDENDDRHLIQITDLVRRVTSTDPEMVSYSDKDATAKVSAFREGSREWITAVRKISEGVDIKRLRVAVIANRPTTELLFRQIVGRVIRVDNKKRPGTAMVFIAKFPQLCEWAARFRDEAEAGLRERDERDKTESEKSESSFVAVDSTHEDGGAITDFGDEFAAAEINAAEKQRRMHPQLVDIPITQLALIRRINGIVPDPIEPANEPLQIEKKRVRNDLNKSVRRLAIRRDAEHPDFGKVWVEIYKHTGARNLDDLFDNYSIDVMRQALQLVDGWLGGRDAAA